MKIAIDVKRGTRTTKFEKNDIIIYDGSEWYVTTKDDLFGELEKRCSNAIASFDAKYNDLLTKVEKFRQEYIDKTAELIPVLEKILGEKK